MNAILKNRRTKPGNSATFALLSLAVLTLAACADADNTGAIANDERLYTYRDASPGGTGKIYLGREISQVMGHLGASWLERPSREAEERTDLLLASLPIESDSVVADIGSGTGYFTLPLAQRARSGTVYAVDIQAEMLHRVRERMQAAGLDNIETVLASETDPGLPRGKIDLALIVDAYHEFSHPREVMAGVVEALKRGGRVVLVEYRGEDPRVPIKRLHKMTQLQARKEMEAVGLVWEQTGDFLPQQHCMIFRKP
jgi:precorrin-6B methylase 2